MYGKLKKSANAVIAINETTRATMTGQMTRDQALDRISRPELSEEQHNSDFEYVADKLDFTVEEFRQIFEGERHTYREFRNKRDLIIAGARLLRMIGLEKRLF